MTRRHPPPRGVVNQVTVPFGIEDRPSRGAWQCPVVPGTEQGRTTRPAPSRWASGGSLDRQAQERRWSGPVRDQRPLPCNRGGGTVSSQARRAVVPVTRRRREEAAESLELLEERARREQAREEDDREAALADLIDAMVPQEPTDLPIEEETIPEVRGGTEFTCTSCHLIYSRSCLADEDRLVCIDCAREESRPRVPGPRAKHGITLEAPCPACGEILMVPEREDAACGFFCPGCGVHVRRWDRRLHLVWNQRYVPEHVPRPQSGAR